MNVTGDADYSRIQDAIDNASAGDTILVHSGIYYENINVNKKLTILGLDTVGYNPVVDSGSSGNAITLNIDEIILEGFNATNSVSRKNTGIKVNSNNNIIKKNTLSNYEYGVFIGTSRNNTIYSNYFFNNNYAIYLNSSENSSFDNNNVSSNDYGIYLDHSENNTFGENMALNNDYCIFLNDSRNNTISANTANSNSWNAIRLISSNYNTLIGNNASSNLYGIRLDSSNGNTLSSNNLLENSYGIRLEFSNENILDSNVINLSGFNAIRLRNSFSNTLKNNKVLNNYYGIYMYYSNNNNIYNNYFNNSNNSFFYAETMFLNPNYWNITETSGDAIVGGAYLGGNFWGKPDGTGFSQTCIDLNGEGICDTGYPLTYENVDYLPLTFPKGYINGSVLDNDTRRGIEGAIVTINSNISIKTNESGFYSLLLKGGNYYLAVIKEPEYYPNNSVMVDVEMNSTVLQDIELSSKSTGNITGIVRNA